MKSAIKERNHSKYRHQMVFHITVPSNILTDMTRMPLGTLGIKFCDSKMFIRRNRLNRLMSHKLKYTNQTILYVLIFISRDSLLNEESTYIYFNHISYTQILSWPFSDHGPKSMSKLSCYICTVYPFQTQFSVPFILKQPHYCMWLYPVSVDKNFHKYISPKLCLTPEIKSKYFRTGECVGIGQTTVPFRQYVSSILHIQFETTNVHIAMPL